MRRCSIVHSPRGETCARESACAAARAAAGSASPMPHSPLDVASLPLAALHKCIDPRWTLRCPAPRRPADAGAARSWLVRDAQAMASGTMSLRV